MVVIRTIFVCMATQCLRNTIVPEYWPQLHVFVAISHIMMLGKLYILEWLIIVTADYGSARLIEHARSTAFLQDKRALS